MASLKSSSLVSGSFLRHLSSRRHKRQMSDTPCITLQQPGPWEWSVDSDESPSGAEAEGRSRSSASPAAIRWQSHKIEAAWITELLQEGQLIWSISQTHSRLCEKEIHFFAFSSYDLGIVCDRTSAQITWEKELSGHPQGTKNHPKSNAPLASTNSRKASLPSVLVKPPNLGFCPFPLHPQAWMRYCTEAVW